MSTLHDGYATINRVKRVISMGFKNEYLRGKKYSQFDQIWPLFDAIEGKAYA
jgi:hypothetical protein